VPKPSRLRSVDLTPAPAAQDAAARSSGVSVKAELTPLGSDSPAAAPAAQDAAARSSGVSARAELTPLGSGTPAAARAAQDAAARPSGVSARAELTPPGSGTPAAAHAPQGAAARPSSASVESVPKRRGRRSFSAAEKLRIVRQAAACTERGDVEALLRREGLYSSHLTAWRKQFALHGSEALAGRKRGRKPKLDAKDRRIAELEQRAVRLEARLSLAEKLIDLQKKVSAILGLNLTTDGER
jgi:transposase